MAIRKPSLDVHYSIPGNGYFEVASERIWVKVDIPNPEFIEEHPGYIAHSYKICGHSNIVLTRYHATSITNLDYDSFTVIDEKTHDKFKASDSLMLEVSKTVDNGIKVNRECQFRGAFGALSDSEVVSVANVIQNYYNAWKSFPNETSYDMVLQYHQSLGKIQRMKDEESGGWIKTRIEEARVEMKRLRDQIEKYEKEENQIYEEAADAMNLLEEKGYDPEEVYREQDILNRVCGTWLDETNWANSITISKSSIPIISYNDASDDTPSTNMNSISTKVNSILNSIRKSSLSSGSFGKEDEYYN